MPLLPLLLTGATQVGMGGFVAGALGLGHVNPRADATDAGATASSGAAALPVPILQGSKNNVQCKQAAEEAGHMQWESSLSPSRQAKISTFKSGWQCDLGWSLDPAPIDTIGTRRASLRRRRLPFSSLALSDLDWPRGEPSHPASWSWASSSASPGTQYCRGARATSRLSGRAEAVPWGGSWTPS